MTNIGERQLPLFYRTPQLLMASTHGDMRLKAGDYQFAEHTNAAPLAIIEFASAMRHYPIVFAETDGFPLAVLGLERANRFVADGGWAEDSYVPAYVRRYPFVFAEMNADSFALALDTASDRVMRGGEEGDALFDNGEPTDLTQAAMMFCREFHGAHIQTHAFVEALKALDLLVTHHADAKLASGKPLTLSGFQVVDHAKFDALDDAIIVEWHRKGWLALVHLHFVSLERFADLVAREAVVEAQASEALSDGAAHDSLETSPEIQKEDV